MTKASSQDQLAGGKLTPSHRSRGFCCRDSALSLQRGRASWQKSMTEEACSCQSSWRGKRERRVRIPMYPSEESLRFPTSSNLPLPPAVPVTLQQRHPLETSPPAHELGGHSRAWSQQLMLCLAPFVSISGPHYNKSKGIIPR